MKKETFNKQIEKLTIEYASKGFDMPKERALQWYERFKDMEDSNFIAIIADVLDTCSFAPCMADLVKSTAYTEVKFNPRELKKAEGTR